MKITVVTGPSGELVALVHAHLSEHRPDPGVPGPHATLAPAPGQRFHEVVAPEGHEDVPREELRAWIVREVARRSSGG